MEVHSQAFSIRDIALRAVGRNLVNFQKLEHCLKALVRTGHVAGPMSELHDIVAKKVSKTSQYTLGKAAQEWLRIAMSDQTPKAQAQSLSEPWVSISLELPIDSARLVAHSEALNTLAIERNALVHMNLATFNFESEPECKHFVAVLDRQNQRILDELAFLSPAIEALLELKTWAMNPESLEEMFNASSTGET